jgi:hypothetical protein
MRFIIYVQHISLKKNLNSDGLNPTNKKKKHALTNSKDSSGALLPPADWNGSVGSASRTKDTGEEDDSMVQSGGFVGDDETDDLERRSLSGFKGGKKFAVVRQFFLKKGLF